jgi:serine/threonine protein kinase
MIHFQKKLFSEDIEFFSEKQYHHHSLMFEEKAKRIIGDYMIQQKIGSGTYASVYKSIHQPTLLPVAIKIINKVYVNTEVKKRLFS